VAAADGRRSGSRAHSVNYLAHLYLADDDAESRIGSLMGDFVRGRIDDRLPSAIRREVIRHRRVDSYSDAHPVFRLSKRRIRPEFRRYGGILIDIYYDHFLARRWSDYSDVPLKSFAEATYGVLRRHQDSFPSRMQRSMGYLVENDLLQSYRQLSGIRRSLQGIESRLRRPSRLREAVVDLEDNYEDLERDFVAFFADLIDYVEQQKRSP
jgi:acyl carrier protein phosphodiesterase